jgi:hypothetical protein
MLYFEQYLSTSKMRHEGCKEIRTQHQSSILCIRSCLEVNMLRNKTPLFLILLIVVGILVYAVGCGNHEIPLSSDLSYENPASSLPPLDGLNYLTRPLDGGYDLLGGNNKGNGNDKGSNDWGTGFLYSEADIDSYGGTLSLEFVKVEVPEGAVRKNRTITVSVLIPDPSVFVWVLGPENYTFHNEVTIKADLRDMDLGGLDPNSIKFYTFEDGQGQNLGQWVKVGGTYNSNGHFVWITTNHFSYWALASD